MGRARSLLGSLLLLNKHECSSHHFHMIKTSYIFKNEFFAEICRQIFFNMLYFISALQKAFYSCGCSLVVKPQPSKLML